VERLLRSVEILQNRIVLMVCYGAGLRIHEVVTLTVGGIDSQRMLIHVRLQRLPVRLRTRTER
jgi:site-specific recombinase XerD